MRDFLIVDTIQIEEPACRLPDLLIISAIYDPHNATDCVSIAECRHSHDFRIGQRRVLFWVVEFPLIRVDRGHPVRVRSVKALRQVNISAKGFFARHFLEHDGFWRLQQELLYMNLPPSRTILIRADESAFWTVAGLRQLDRIFRALNESLGEPAAVWVEWDPAISGERRWIPSAGDSGRIDLQTTDCPASADLVLSTHQFISRSSPVVRRSVTDLRAQWNGTDAGADWEYLARPEQIPACEKRFLGGSGKSQDGLVARFLNRPISRAVSRVLLKFPITPSGWTLGIFILPLAGAIFLARGGYASIVAGLFLFQLFSILDGCDGEIARAKYLESSFGRRLDTWCDILGNLILAVSLGYGLSRSYLVEGVVVAALIATNEIILALPARDHVATTSLKSAGAIYPRHQRMVEHSGLLVFGPRVAGWLIQLTKRDVAIFVFLLLGIGGEPAWILHLLGAVAAISMLLALKARLASGRIR